MSSATSDDLLDALLPSWKRRLQAWCLDGSFSTAVRQALRLPEIPVALQELVGQWAQGEFSALPPTLLLSEPEMNGAAGAYATSRRTIYLNADWLLQASPAQVLAVLSEELGHHLDVLLNADDTPGDEGELFAALLPGEGAISAEQRDRLLVENDQGSIVVNGMELMVERAAVASAPIPASYPGRTSGETRISNAFAALKGDGSVVTWGDSSWGGNSSGVADQLSSGVTQIFSNTRAFAALKRDGSASRLLDQMQTRKELYELLGYVPGRA
ncbi:MAG: hypothetical protein EBU97_01895 [Rhodobacteraceae bacterium]|nr:hypothetical protein [Paracoccaceae bacterium]